MQTQTAHEPRRPCSLLADPGRAPVLLTPDDVRAELARRRVTGRAVAEAASCSSTLVSLCLKGERRSDAVTRAIEALTGLSVAQALRGEASAQEHESPGGGHPPRLAPDGHPSVQGATCAPAEPLGCTAPV